MQAKDVMWATRYRGDVVDREIGGVGGEHGVWPRDRREPRENLLLDLHILINCLNDEVAVLESREVEGRRQQIHCFVDIVGGDATLCRRCLIIATDRRGTALERACDHFHDRNGYSA